jgi:hypothetical protein
MRVGVRVTLWVSAKYMIRNVLLCQCVKLRKIADASKIKRCRRPHTFPGQEGPVQ